MAEFLRFVRGLSPLTGGEDHLFHPSERGRLTCRITAISSWSASGASAYFVLGGHFFIDSVGTFMVSFMHWSDNRIDFVLTHAITRLNLS